MTYWLDLFTPKSWQEFQKAGGTVSGFPERRWKSVQRVAIGDILVCYMARQSRWFAAFEVVSRAFHDHTPIWTDSLYPSRLKVKALVILAPSKGIPARETLSKLKLFSGLKDARRWSGALRTVPRTLQREDGDFLLNELKRREGTPLEPKAEPGSYHDQIRQLLFELGEMEGRHPEKEKPIDGERIDVAWKRIERGDPTIVFEVQISGNFYEALAKLKHAWDKWNSRPFLVTTEAFRGKALDWVRGSFHEMQEELRIVDCEKVKELHEAIRKSKNLKEELGIG